MYLPPPFKHRCTYLILNDRYIDCVIDRVQYSLYYISCKYIYIYAYDNLISETTKRRFNCLH